jgi:hypothetical protein
MSSRIFQSLALALSASALFGSQAMASCDWGMTKFSCYTCKPTGFGGYAKHINHECGYTQVDAQAICAVVPLHGIKLWWGSHIDGTQFSCPGNVPPPPPPTQPNQFRIRNRWNPNCLASIGNSKTLDNPVVMGTCDSSNSIWYWNGRQIKNRWNPNCLASIGNSQALDNPVVMGTCDSSNSVWSQEGEQFKNEWNPNCLGSIGPSKNLDNPVVMGACGIINGQWYIESVR